MAAALHLDEIETTTLLQAADHPALAELRTQITTGPDRFLLETWPISRAPFQAIADLPYFIGREHELAQLRRTLPWRLGHHLQCVGHGWCGQGLAGRTPGLSTAR